MLKLIEHQSLDDIIKQARAISRPRNVHFHAGVSKIEKYGLQNLVWKLVIEKNEGLPAVVKACNAEIKRLEIVKPTWISINNIKHHLKRIQRAIAEYDTEFIRERLNKAVNIVEKIHDSISRIEEKAEEAYDRDSISELVALSRVLNESMHLLANVQGKLQPGITIQMYNTSVSQIVNVIEEAEFVLPEARAKLLEGIASVIDIVPAEVK